MTTVTFRFHRGLVDWLKTIPGSKWEPRRALWYFPAEMVPALRDKAAEVGGKVVTSPNPPSPPEDTLPAGLLPFVGSLHPYQRIAVARGVQSPAWLFNDEMGLGKSAEAITSLRLLNVDEAIIVCPAQARLTWHHPKHTDPADPLRGQLDRWWPEHPPVHVWEPGKKNEPSAINVVSYEMLDKLLDAGVGWPQAIVFDEIHYLQNPRSERSIAAKRAVDTYPNAWRAGLTGTPITNGPDSIANPLNILYPGRFESGFKFASRYSVGSHNGYGWEFAGVNPDTAAELRYRLGFISSRTTQAEVAHLLPPFSVGVQFIDPRKRLEAGAQFAGDALENGVGHVALLTHHLDAADGLSKLLQKADAEVYVITGENSHAERAEIVGKARAAKRSILIATLHSVNVAIDLTFCSVVGFVESYQRPADMIQALGRFSRLSGQGSVNVTLFASEAGDDPAEAVAKKVAALSQIIKSGRSEQGVASVVEEMRTAGMSNEDISALLNMMAASYAPES